VKPAAAATAVLMKSRRAIDDLLFTPESYKN
jgi:hypothetical protein